MKALKNKQAVQMIIIFAAIFVLFNVLFLLIPFPKRAASWVTYVFSLLSFFGAAGIAFYAFKDAETIKSKFYGFPVFRMAYLYLIAQTAVTVVITIVAAFVKVPVWIPIVLGLVLALLALIGTVAADVARENVEKEDEKGEDITRKHTYFKLDVESLLYLAETESVKKAVEKLCEKVRYSDPVSSEDLSEIEIKLSVMVKELKETMNREEAEVLKDLECISTTVDERNRLCKALKKGY